MRVRGRKDEIRVDRSTLMTLVRELRAGKPGPGGRDLRYALHGAELVAYLEFIAKEDPEEARSLWVHLCSPYDVPSGNDRLAHLFDGPLLVAKALNVAASSGALVARTLPYAARQTGSIVDRVASLHILTMTLSYATTHRNAETLFDDAARLGASLANEKNLLLCECGWLLEAQVAACQRARRASTSDK